MKHLPILPLAVVATAAVMAFAGAGSASADVFCTANANPCPAGNTITTVVTSVTSGTSNLLTSTGGETLAKCTVGSLSDKIEAQGEAVNPSGSVSTFTWEGCSTTTDTVAKGTFEVRTESGQNIIWFKDIEVTTQIFGVSCIYTFGTGTRIGPLTTGTKASFAINAAISKTSNQSFLCPTTVRWTGNHTITNHSAVFVSTS